MTQARVRAPDLLSSSSQIQELVQSIRLELSSLPSAERLVAFDTEFIRENTFYPMVELIQVATRTRSWLVDARAFKKNHRPGPKGGHDPGIEPLLELFRDPQILKIVHAAQGDQECVYANFGCTAAPTLDTAVAGSLCGLGESVGLSRLLLEVLGVEIKKGHSRTHWGVRPLPSQLIDYAHGDVEYLVDLALRLMEQLRKSDRLSWAQELTAKWEDINQYEPDLAVWSDRMARSSRLDPASAAVLYRLLIWREQRVRHLNLPRRWVADDAVLMDLAKVKPKDPQHLQSFRGLNKGELKHSVNEILAAIRKGLENPTDFKPARRTESASTAEAHAIDLLQVYIQVLSAQHRVAAKHFLTAAQLLPLLRAQPKNLDELGQAADLSPEAVKLIGQDLLDFLNGKMSLRIHARGVEVVR